MQSHETLTTVKCRVTYLSTALDNIEGADSHVGETTGENTSDHALSIVASVVYVTYLVIRFSNWKKSKSKCFGLANNLFSKPYIKGQILSAPSLQCYNFL